MCPGIGRYADRSRSRLAKRDSIVESGKELVKPKEKPRVEEKDVAIPKPQVEVSRPDQPKQENPEN